MMNILVIDDLDINIRVISSILSFRKNITVAQALSGKEAISLIEEQKFDIIITDIFMPDMNGFQLADIISDNYGAIPIIAVSAGDIDVEMECKEHGIDHYLSKPIFPDSTPALTEKATVSLLLRESWKILFVAVLSLPEPTFLNTSLYSLCCLLSGIKTSAYSPYLFLFSPKDRLYALSSLLSVTSFFQWRLTLLCDHAYPFRNPVAF